MTWAGVLRSSSALGLTLGILRPSATLASMDGRKTLESLSENSFEGETVNQANTLKDAHTDVQGGGATLTQLARLEVIQQVLGGRLKQQRDG